MKLILTLATCVLVLVALSAILFVAYGRDRTWQRIAGDPDLGPFRLQSIERSPHPNDALLCTGDLCAQQAKVDKVLPTFKMSSDRLILAIEGKLENSGMAFTRVDDEKDAAQSRYVVRTRALRFPDTIQFQAIDLEKGKSGLIAYGKSQIGTADHGTNLRRLLLLTKDLDV